jgi:hypothetical protein
MLESRPEQLRRHPGIRVLPVVLPYVLPVWLLEPGNRNKRPQPCQGAAVWGRPLPIRRCRAGCLPCWSIHWDRCWQGGGGGGGGVCGAKVPWLPLRAVRERLVLPLRTGKCIGVCVCVCGVVVQEFTALDRAVHAESVEAVRFLLSQPAIKPKQECMKTTPLKRAVESKSDDPTIVKLLVDSQVGSRLPLLLGAAFPCTTRVHVLALAQCPSAVPKHVPPPPARFTAAATVSLALPCSVVWQAYTHAGLVSTCPGLRTRLGHRWPCSPLSLVRTRVRPCVYVCHSVSGWVLVH